MTYKEPQAQKECDARESNLAKLPPRAYVLIQSQSVVGIVRRGVSGYFPVQNLRQGESNGTFQEHVDCLNESEGITKAQASAMFHGSMFGWHVPAANPDHRINQEVR